MSCAGIGRTSLSYVRYARMETDAVSMTHDDCSRQLNQRRPVCQHGTVIETLFRISMISVAAEGTMSC